MEVEEEGGEGGGFCGGRGASFWGGGGNSGLSDAVSDEERDGDDGDPPETAS